VAAARSGSARRFYYDVNGWLFVLPALALMALFLAFPILDSLSWSLYSGKGLIIKFAGFGNIERLARDPVFLHALGNTMTFFVVQVPIMITLALIFASLLNNPNLRFVSLFRTAIFLPCVSSLVVYSVLFKSMFSVDGIVNSTLIAIGLASGPIQWFTDVFWAKVLIVIAITWRWTGYNMIFYLAALQNIDRSIYEAARIDGVPAWARFVHLTVPLLKPVILFTTITSTIGTLQLFDEVYNLSAEGKGGPADSTLTLSLYIYNLTFRYVPSYGYAATVSYVIVVMVALLALIQFYFARERT